MGSTRRHYDASFKTKVALEAIKVEWTVAEVASECGVHSNQITKWMVVAGLYDNIFVERLWLMVKYEDVYLKDYSDMRDVKAGLSGYFEFYNNERIHQALGNRTPRELNQTCLAYQKYLMSRSVPGTGSVLSQ